jgi:hypothetical protein
VLRASEPGVRSSRHPAEIGNLQPSRSGLTLFRFATAEKPAFCLAACRRAKTLRRTLALGLGNRSNAGGNVEMFPSRVFWQVKGAFSIPLTAD